LGGIERETENTVNRRKEMDVMIGKKVAEMIDIY
jgi:hypothetical protein